VSAAFATVADENLAFLPAHQLLALMAAGQLSSRTLLELQLARADQSNPTIGAVVAFDRDAARQRADAADLARKQGEHWGALHGLPITIKDTYEVAGMPCTAGAPVYRNHRPQTNAWAVQRLLDAGAIVYGKTNVPLMASDIQSYNAVYGTTNNPWDVQRTPGGSSGGAAAALACGLTPLELGSDIGGSIRIPAHFCGVYGHKSSHGIVPLRGHIPGPPGSLAEPDMAVAGPLARSAQDLALMLDVLTGPTPTQASTPASGWALQLPPPRAQRLQDYRVLMWMDDPYCPVDSATRDAGAQLQATLRAAGVQVVCAPPDGIGLEEIVLQYFHRLGGAMASAHTPGQRMAMGWLAPLLRHGGRLLGAPPYGHRYFSGCAQSHAQWLRENELVLALRARFVALFDTFDVVLMPVAMGTAFAHDHSQPVSQRRITVDGRRRAYADMFGWIAPATLLGLPATSAPLGLTEQGLPMGIQIVGGPFQDRTTIAFAALLAPLVGDFQRPGQV
jgi:amidase